MPADDNIIITATVYVGQSLVLTQHDDLSLSWAN